jgi:hypothetical protein
MSELSNSNPENEVQDLVEETLVTLGEFSKTLEQLSRDSATDIIEIGSHHRFDQVLEGVSTFTNAVIELKNATESERVYEVRGLEIELLGIMKSLLAAQEKAQIDALAALLSDRLPANLSRWREKGLPALIPTKR